uniref:Uncharacterized protein n=1 Tax=Glossina palpalis gambiensis TaxID=67801 RepID=A0A1B0BXP3_9MUSC
MKYKEKQKESQKSDKIYIYIFTRILNIHSTVSGVRGVLATYANESSLLSPSGNVTHYLRNFKEFPLKISS